MNLQTRFTATLTVLLCALLTSIVSQLHAQEIPKLTDFEPESYKKQEVFNTIKVMTLGDGADRSYAFYPENPSAKQLPLVIFLHGWMGTNPKNFGALIDHLVRRGSVVIYPVYQVDGNTVPQSITDTAAKSIALILKKLELENPDLIDTQKTMYYGFSMGASMSINFANNPSKYGLPPPKGMVLAAPGDAHHVAHKELAISIVNQPISQIPLSIPIALLTGQEDKTIGVQTATAYWNEICQQKRQKIFITWPSGKADDESIASGHGAPGAPDERYDFSNINGPTPIESLERLESFPESKSINNLDFYGQWKVVTGFLDAIKNSSVPTWIFTENQIMSDLGKFKNGQAYPHAWIEKSCPAPIPISTNNNAKGKSHQTVKASKKKNKST